MVPTEQDDDPLVAELIEASLRPSLGRVAPEVLEDMRLVLRLFLTTHPEAAAVVDSLRARPAVSRSGDVAREQATGEPASNRSGARGRSA